ncbi:amidohydrolase family protein [Marispirochaeta sp.]|jgi:N-acetylglucosamine-6-phosphate deacetylase|uniref:N-acetylglucosamine-6-phosphate deacetylase n=1 Tax=Marispirochaeta sp. TaxID=2038653 RepID=UPI0029C7994D|nr:amidohydrolase family protein [Marispirochaeta sp.]
MKEFIIAKSIFTEDLLQIILEDGVFVGVDIFQHDSGDSLYTVPYIAPGFFDIQVNGYAGINYSESLSPEKIVDMTKCLSESGTTFHLPTIITNSENCILESIDAIVKARKKHFLLRKTIPGIHIEGPFISSKKGARGVHDPQHIRSCDFEEFKRWQEQAEGLIKLVTISPEDDVAIDFIRKVTKQGVRVGIGHTSVNPEQIEAAVEAGASLSTHLGNGSPGYLPRLNNFIWKELSEDRLYASIIADGFHLPPYVLDTYTRAKGKKRIILISDVAALAGSPPGLYRWGDMDVEVFPDGHMGLQGTLNLAGASLLLDTCIAHLHESTRLSLSDSVFCATVNPYTYFHHEAYLWTDNPVPGKEAFFTLFHYQKGDGRIKVHRTQLGSNILFTSEDII